MIDLSFRKHTQHLGFVQFTSEIEQKVTEFVGKWHSDIGVTQYLGKYKEDSKNWFDDCLNHGGKLYHLITYDEAPIGYVGIHVPWPWSDVFELNLVIGEESYRDRGVGTAVGELMIRYGCKQKFKKIRVKVHPDNISSNFLALKALEPVRSYQSSLGIAIVYEGSFSKIIEMIDSIGI
jgi:RimJ/RimL family protein N-acetyltransferase